MALIYFVGAIAVIFYNYENIIPSIVSVFSDVFTGTAASGGFLGAGFAFAFNRGVNRGLFSNEAGQGSAPIAHAAARAHEPVSEGLVALLEPFIDTIIICTLTGLVILSSGVWNQKYENQFQTTDIVVLDKVYDQTSSQDQEALHDFLLGRSELSEFTGDLNVVDGKVQNALTILHARSVAENIVIKEGERPYTGTIPVTNGVVPSTISQTFEGKSLVHSAPLTTIARNNFV